MKADPKTYLFVGDDSFKREKIKEVAAKFLNPSNKDFNYDLIYAKDFKHQNLRDIFSGFPVGANFRVVRLKDIEALNPHAKEQLLAYFKKPSKSLILILESSRNDLKEAFLKNLSSKVDFFYLANKERQINVFDLCRAIINKDIPLALKLLGDLDADAKNAPGILGGVIWQWEQMKHLISSIDLEKGFQILHDIDRRIKTGKLKPKLALEMLVISLTSKDKRKVALLDY